MRSGMQLWKARSWRVLLWAALMCAGPWAAANDEDAYQKGLKAYQVGDVAAAMATLRPAAEAGHAPSQALLGYIYDYSDFVSEALALYKAAAAKGNAEGHSGLAKLYLEGRGVPRDAKLAFGHLVQAADLGHGSAINAVADAYLAGSIGATPLEADDAKASAAIRRAAEREYLPAMDGLAKVYLEGRFGVAADPKQAAQWQAKASAVRAKRGLPMPKTKP